MERMTHSRFTEAEREFIRKERVLRFNSLGKAGHIHSVPVCFAFDGNNFFTVSQISAKRLSNIKANNSVSLELDVYSDDWSKAKGVLVYGTAQFIESEDEKKIALNLLKEKYRQYREGPIALSTQSLLLKTVPNEVKSWFITKPFSA